MMPQIVNILFLMVLICELIIIFLFISLLIDNYKINRVFENLKKKD